MQRVASRGDVPADRGLRVELGETKILLLRDGSEIRAYAGTCPHAGAPLDEGAVCDGRLICPWHKAVFRVADGALLEPPALDGLARHEVRVEGEDIFVSAEPVPSSRAASPPDGRTMLIVGAGAAGTAAAAALREFGFGGRVVLVGREPGDPYDRTALSKFVTAGAMKPDEVDKLRPPGFYAAHAIERVGGEVRRLDLPGRRAILADGRELAFDQALLATGGTPRRLDLPGGTLAGVHTLRNREDAAAILADLRPGARAVVLGSSFIGLEVASGLREQNIEVDIVSPEDTPFARQLGPRIGQSLRRMHERHGVRFHLPSEAERLEGDSRVTAVVLKDGRRLPADIVLMAVGARPATDIEGVATSEDGGIDVDAGMRVTEGLFAAGDIARFPMAGLPVRIEHWRVAQQQARVAARNMLGQGAIYDGVPFFWTYQGGKRFEVLGHASEWDEEVIEGDLEQQEFVSVLARQGMVVGVVACGRERPTATLAERMREPLPVGVALDIIRAA